MPKKALSPIHTFFLFVVFLRWALPLQSDHHTPLPGTPAAQVMVLILFGNTKVEGVGHLLSPASILDRGGTWILVKPYSHSYRGFESFGS